MDAESINIAIDEIWIDDKLDRKDDAVFLTNFILNHLSSSTTYDNSSVRSINIDAPWGYGKTFFLKRLKLTLELHNIPCAYINAWEDNFSEEPIVPLISSIEEAILDLNPLDNDTEKSLREFKAQAVNVLKMTARSTFRHWTKKSSARLQIN